MTQIYENQLVEINNKDDKIIVKSKQNKSTPGIYFKLVLYKNEKYKITFKGKILKGSNVWLWIAYNNKTNIEFSPNYKFDDQSKTIEYILENKTNTFQNYKIGILFKDPNINDKFQIDYFDFINLNCIPPLIQMPKNDCLYIYFYRGGLCNLKWQLSIRDNLISYMDTISLDQLEMIYKLLDRYKVIILDYMAIIRYNPYFYQNKMLQFLKTYKGKIGLYLEDIHEYTFLNHKNVMPNQINNIPQNEPGIGTKSFVNFLKDYNIRYLISRYMCQEFYNIIFEGQNFIRDYHYLTHHIDNNIFKNYHLDKKYDILMYGNYHKASYPFRYRLRSLIEKYKNKLKIKIIPNRHPILDEDLSKLINQSWLTIATLSNFDYLVCKYFEIGASNSMVLGNINRQGKEIFNDNLLHVNNEMTDDEIMKKIFDQLNNKKEILKKCEIMNHKIKNEYSYQHIGKKFARICKLIINDIPIL